MSKLVFITEARFIKGKNGIVYGESSFNKSLWNRYLSVFSSITVVARLREDEQYESDPNTISSLENVNFFKLPYFVGPKEYMEKRMLVKEKLNEISVDKDAVFICRLPGTIGNLAIPILKINKIPYGVEVVGDPWDVFSKTGVSHIFRVFFKWYYYYKLKSNVKDSIAALYVTDFQLQKRYPVGEGKFQAVASNVEIQDEDFAIEPCKLVNKDRYEILSVGSLEQMYKAPDILVKVIDQLLKKGVNCHLTWLGEGKFLGEMRKLVRTLGIEENVEFKGNVSMKEVREELLDTDLFVLISRTEGLPRAIIEAIATGLPCIGTRVGGIPELLTTNALVGVDDINEIVDRIELYLTSEKLYNSEAKRNLKHSKRYNNNRLTEQRNRFYKYLIDVKH